MDAHLERLRLEHLVAKVIEPDHAPATRRFVVAAFGIFAVLEFLARTYI